MKTIFGYVSTLLGGTHLSWNVANARVSYGGVKIRCLPGQRLCCDVQATSEHKQSVAVSVVGREDD